MSGQVKYVPILKWRQGEYLALGRSIDAVKDWIYPMFEIPVEQWDFEKEEPAKSLDDHLKNFGKRLSKNWQKRACLIDSPYLSGDDSMANGDHHLARLFNLARASNCQGIPVTGIERHADYQTAVANIVVQDGRGCGIRLVADDLDDDVALKLQALMKMIGVNADQVDIIIDSSADVVDSPATQASIWRAWLESLPSMSDWRSVTVAGGSFPASLSPSASYRPHADVNRSEWRAYLKLLTKDLERRPWFGDYGCASPRTEMLDPRTFDPNAKIKYTIDEKWRVVVGIQVKRNGRDQYRDLCRHLKTSVPHCFLGRSYSWGDEYIDDCSTGASSTGGSSTWPTVATNHHVAKVVRDVAKQSGSSTAP